MHTLYKIYGKDDRITGFVIDDVPATQSFYPMDRGPLSYLQSIVDNLNAYIKKNGSLTDESDYIVQVQHGQFDLTYGVIEDKRTENPNYTFKSGTPASSSAPVSSSAASSSAASSSSAPASEAASSAATPSK